MHTDFGEETQGQTLSWNADGPATLAGVHQRNVGAEAPETSFPETRLQHLLLRYFSSLHPVQQPEYFSVAGTLFDS